MSLFWFVVGFLSGIFAIVYFPAFSTASERKNFEQMETKNEVKDNDM